MITIINKYTGEEICKYSSALVSESTNNSFIAPVKASGVFRGRWNAIKVWRAMQGKLSDTLTY